MDGIGYRLVVLVHGHGVPKTFGDVVFVAVGHHVRLEFQADMLSNSFHLLFWLGGEVFVSHPDHVHAFGPQKLANGWDIVSDNGVILHGLCVIAFEKRVRNGVVDCHWVSGENDVMGLGIKLFEKGF